MTYCLGWISGGVGYLVADSAETSSRPPRESQSSFGEQHPSGETFVEQGVLKVYTFPGAALTFAGTASLGEELVSVLGELIRSGTSPYDGLVAAIQSVLPVSDQSSVQVLFLSREADRVHLFSFDSRRDTEPQERTGIAHAGSGSDRLRDLTEGLIEGVSKQDAAPPAVLAAALALLQGTGAHQCLMEERVGGQFNGVFLTPNEGHWQPDIFYVFYDSQDPNWSMRCVSSVVRDNVAVVGSSLTRDTRCFAQQLSEAELSRWKERWIPEVQNLCAKGKAQYVVFIDTRHWRVVVVEQLGLTESNFLRFLPPGDDPQNAPLDLSTELAEILTEPMGDRPMVLRFLGHRSIPAR